MNIKGRLSQLERAIGKRAMEPRGSEDIGRRWVRELPCWQLQVLARAEHWLSQNPPREDWLSEGPPEHCFGGDGLRILFLYGLILRALRREVEAGVVSEDAPMAERLESVMTAGGLETEFRELVQLLRRHGAPQRAQLTAQSLRGRPTTVRESSPDGNRRRTRSRRRHS